MIVFQVSGSQETFHQIFKRVQKVAEGVLVHPLQQGQQDPGIKVGEKRKLDKIPDKKKKIPKKKPCSGFEHVFLGEKKLGKVQVRPNKKCKLKRSSKKSH